MSLIVWGLSRETVRLGLMMYDVKLRPLAIGLHRAEPDSPVVHNDLEKLHLGFVRDWCRLQGSEPNWLIHRELGRLPLHYSWWWDVVQFANRVI